MRDFSSASFGRRGFSVSSAILLSSVLWGCGSVDSDLPPKPPCPEDAAGCVTTTGGGSTSNGTGGGGVGGNASSNDISGTLGVLNEPTFSVVAPYVGEATIMTTSDMSKPIESPYGAAMPTFKLPSVQKGLTWFFVRDETVGGTGILSTSSVLAVPAAGPVTLPVIDLTMLSTIVSTLPAPTVLDTAKAHLVMKIVRNGQPLAGATLNTPLPGAIIAYDTGAGLYSNQTKQTGPAGVVLVFNADAPSNGELRELQLTDVVGQAYTVTIRMAAASASYAGFDLK